MFAIVATARYLLLVDLNSRTVTPLEGHRPEYYGVSWAPQDTSLTLSHSGIDTIDLVDLATYTQSEKGWISSGAVNSPAFLSAPHQILWGSDGRIICTNTGRNAISVIELDKPGRYHEARISAARWDRLSPTHAEGDHVNSVFEKDGQLFVLAHRHDRGSQLAVFSYPELALLSLESAGRRVSMHNIWVTEQGQKIACHSEAGALVDLHDDSVLWEAGVESYTRGLAASDDIVLVGDSRKSGRDLRRSSLSGLWILDRRTWTAMDYLCLGPYGVVNEIRLLDVADQAHHGHPFAGLPALLAGTGMLGSIAQERLACSAQALADRARWRNFEMMFGTPEAARDGARIAPADQLTIMLHKAAAPHPPLSLEYELTAATGGSHVSAVVGYHGKGGDTDMLALMLLRTGEHAASAIWRHDGETWQVTPEAGKSGLPLRGVMQLRDEANAYVLYVDGREVLRQPRNASIRPGGRIGIRFIGARVRPVQP